MAEFTSRNDPADVLRAASSGNRAGASAGRLSGLAATVVAGVAAAALCAPFLHTVYWLGDEGILLNGAVRMLHGGRLYADFFEFLPPAGFVVTAAWFRVAGISLLSARLLTLSVIAGIACFTTLACRAACRETIYPLLVVIAWLVMTQGFGTQLSHHWLTTLFSMIVAWATLSSLDRPDPRLREPLIAGLAAGWAAMTIETSGALVMLAGAAAFAGSRWAKRHLLVFVAASAVAPAVLLASLAAAHELRAAVSDVIVFPATHYAAIQWVPFGFCPCSYLMTAQIFLMILVFPMTAILLTLCCLRDWPGCLDNPTLRACVAFAFAGFIGCYPRSDAWHISFFVPLEFPLFTYCLKEFTAGWMRKFQALAAVAGFLICFPASLVYWAISQQALHAPTVPTARGNAAFLWSASGAGALAARLARTPADDSYFFYPVLPMMSFLTARQQLSRYDLFTPGYTSPSQYEEACLAVMEQASWVVIDRQWTDPRRWKRVFPAMRDPLPSETRRFESALKSGFAPVARYGEFELRRRTEAVSPAACTGVAR